MENARNHNITSRRGRPRKYNNADEKRAANTEQRRVKRQAARARRMEPPAPTYFPAEQAAIGRDVETLLPPMSPVVNAAAGLDHEEIEAGEEPPQLALDDAEIGTLGTSDHILKFSNNYI